MRKICSSSINEEILKNFKMHCNNLGLPYNVVIELFMSTYINNDFVVCPDEKNPSRVIFTYSVDEDLQKNFKKKCRSNNMLQNIILEKFMELFAGDKISVKLVPNTQSVSPVQ